MALFAVVLLAAAGGGLASGCKFNPIAPESGADTGEATRSDAVDSAPGASDATRDARETTSRDLETSRDSAPDSDGSDSGSPDTESNCSNGRDDDGDQKPDCRDPDCDGETCVRIGGATCRNRTCAETNCSDGKDNEIDGATDCADTDCSSSCSSSGEAECYDGKDEDEDGKTDCADREDCDSQKCTANGNAVCRGGECHETNCSNRYDDDLDGDIDDEDSDC